MELKDIISISGMPGLHKIIGRNQNGLIVETLDATKKRFATNMRQRISILSDIAIFTNEGEMKLWEVLKNAKAAVDAGQTIADQKSDNDTIKNSMSVLVPDYDKEKVYISDMKKLLTWYHTVKDIVDYEKLGVEPEEETNEETGEVIVKKSNDKPAVKNVKTAAPRTPNGAKTKTTTPRKMGS